MQATITNLHAYPLKAAGGVDLSEAPLGARGFPFDRHWMLIDRHNGFVSQRQMPQMALLAVGLQDDHLEVFFPQKQSLVVPFEQPSTEPLTATMHPGQPPFEVVSQGPAASQWFTECLGPRKGGPLRLVRLAADCIRSVPDPLFAEEATLHLADAYPYLVTSNSSLKLVNEQFAQQGVELPMRRFRPNIVLDLEPAWIEMRGGTLGDQSGRLRLRLCKPCGRCGVPQVNPATGQRDVGIALHQVLRQVHGQFLGSESDGPPENVFGQNAIVEEGFGEVLRVGQQLILQSDHA